MPPPFDARALIASGEAVAIPLAGGHPSAPRAANALAYRLPSRLPRLVPVVVGVTVLIIAILTITPWPVGVFEDDAIYTVLARSLATGEGYRMINMPGSPHATHYPPGYPFVLSLLWRLYPQFPDNIVAFKFANAAFLALAALGAYAFARRRFTASPLVAGGAALAGTISVVVLLITGVILSEPLFMALLLPALLLAERAGESGDTRQAALAGGALGMLALVRTLGAVAIPAALLVLLFRRRWRGALALCAAAALVLVPWQLWVSRYQHEIPPLLAGKYGAYGPWLADGYRAGGLAFARDVAVANVKGLNHVLGYVFMPVRPAWAHVATFIAVTAIFVGGLLAIVRRAPVTALFLAGYLAVVVLWPFEPDRFVLPLWPLLALLFVAVVAALWRWRARGVALRVLRAAALAGALAVFAGHAMYNMRGYRGAWWTSVQRQSGEGAKPIVEWVARHTAMSDVLSTEHDLIVYLYTGRQAVPVSTFLARERTHPLSKEETLASVREVIERYHPRFYITAWPAALEAAQALSAGPRPLLRPAGTTTNAMVFERIIP